VAAGSAACVALTLGGLAQPLQDPAPPMLVAPMVGNLDACLWDDEAANDLPLAFRPHPASCAGVQGSAAELLAQTLAPLNPGDGPDARPDLRLGYTLNVPLLRLLKPNQPGQSEPPGQADQAVAAKSGAAKSVASKAGASKAGAGTALQPAQLGRSKTLGQSGQLAGWVVDEDRVARVVHTLAQVKRPAVLYLFATHFGVDAPIERALLQDPRNLAETQYGVLPADKYLDYSIYPWTVARTDNGITRAREMAIDALAQQICRTPQALQHIEAVTLLGEVHQLYPQFETGMGFESPYQIGDYSAASQAAFRAYLVHTQGSIATLNARLGSQFRSFDEVKPPRLDIRKDRLSNFFEHIDATAHGSLPVSGWVHVPEARWPKPAPAGDAPHAGDASPTASQPPATLMEANKPWVRIAVNGQVVGRVRAELSRQDVAEAKPEFGTPDVGWRFDLPFAQLAPGRYRVDALLELPGGVFTLGTRHVNVLGRDQRMPEPGPLPAPQTQALPADVAGHLDWPRESMDVYFNPLVPLWHAFRAQQVKGYLQQLQRAVAHSCLAQKPLYVHQLYPFGNPSWDANRYAVDASLKATADWRLGVSLYGASSYGFEVGRRLKGWQQHQYGITEFHPMRAMTGEDMARTFALHRRQGAQFLSFFMEAKRAGTVPQRMHNAFSLDENNPAMHGAVLYDAVRQVMTGQAQAEEMSR
jgi:hypothetical protein